MIDIVFGDCREVMAAMEPESIDAIVTDPPYELGFMGKKWDGTGISFDPATWAECLRVLKPGGHMVAFGGSRTFHRIAVAIEDAGFEIRDTLCWLYGSGFPKSLDVSKAIDKQRGHWRVLASAVTSDNGSMGGPNYVRTDKGSPVTPEAEQWQGWGTALKPAWEIIAIARKPFTPSQERDIIVASLERMRAQLWSLFDAKDAARIFKSSPAEHEEAFAFARWSADERSSTGGVLSGLMDTSQSDRAMITSWNIVSSWLDILDELWKPESTSTTETATSLTIDWKTLNSLVSRTTLESIIEVSIHPDGSAWSALPVARYFNAVAMNMNAIRELSVLEAATSTGGDAGLRPNLEPIIMARKPLAKGHTVAANVLEHGGAGAINIDGCRIEGDMTGAHYGGTSVTASDKFPDLQGKGYATQAHDQGRWPANVVLNEEAAELLGEPSRFYYVAKANKRERGEGNTHSTVKPVALMRWLVRLITPPGGTVLDPFAGSGTTGVAAVTEGFDCILIEREQEYIDIIRGRTQQAQGELGA